MSGLQLHKDKRNAWNYSAHRFDSDVAWGNSCMATQQKLGVRAKWRSGIDRVDHRDTVADESHLISRDSCIEVRREL